MMEQEEEEKRVEEEGKRGDEEEDKEEEEQKMEGDQNTSETDHLGNLLFEMKGSSKEYWHYMHLVAKEGSDMTQIKSTDAI